MVKLYFAHLRQNLKAQLSYKGSFFLSFFSHFLVMFSSYFVIISLFSKFTNVATFTLYEVLLCYGIIYFGFSFNEIFFRGMDVFEDLIIEGTLDRFFVRPQGIIFQCICEKMHIVKISRNIQAIAVIIIALVKLKIKFTITNIYLIFSMIVASVLIFFGIFILTASYCFITVQGLEIKNVLTNGGKEIAQYPIGIFRKGLIFVFSYIIPFASVNYYPLLYLTGRSSNNLCLLSPWLTLLYLVPCFILFNIGLKHYSSTGS